MNKDWENNLRKSLEDYQVNAPDGLWESIETGLVHDTGAKVRPLFWLSAVAAAVAAILFISREENHPIEELAVVEQISPEIDEPELIPTESEKVDTYQQPKREVQPGPVLFDIDESISTEPDEAAEDVVVEEGRVSEPVADDGTEAVRKYWDDISASETGDPRRSRERKRILLAASVSGSEGAKERYGSYGGFAYSDARSYFCASDGRRNSFSPVGSVLLANLAEEIETQVHHHQPIRYVIECEFMLSDRIGIASGLSYSRLVSDMTSGSSAASYKTRQKIDYLGIPLSLNYHLLDSKHLRLYAGVGVMGEKAVQGSSVTSYNYGGPAQPGSPVRFQEKELQWSANASLGGEVKLLPRLSVFVDPGLSYYFDNGSDVDNIYKERPLNFNLRLGVRTTLGR